MHYRNGREAKNGDRILQIAHDGRPCALGILHDAKPGEVFCNGMIAPIHCNDALVSICDCLHVDDVMALLAEKGLAKRPNGM